MSCTCEYNHRDILCKECSSKTVAEVEAIRGKRPAYTKAKPGAEPVERAWLLMSSGIHAYPLAMTKAMVNIRDIAHAQSMQCRYGGHVRRFYSVAQHSTLMARHVFSEDAGSDARFVGRMFCEGHWNIPLARLGLMMQLHDASDPYFIDIPRPVKYQLYFKRRRPPSTSFTDQHMSDFEYVPVKELEIPIERLVAEMHGLPYPFPDIVHEWDERMLTTERDHLLTFDPEWRCPDVGLPVPMEYWLPERAEFEFMLTFNRLMQGLPPC